MTSLLRNWLIGEGQWVKNPLVLLHIRGMETLELGCFVAQKLKDKHFLESQPMGVARERFRERDVG